MATAFPTVAVSLVYMLWDACRRARRRRTPPPPPPDEPPAGDEQVEYRLDCLTVLAKPLPRR
ncbi:MAG TPA: hypothetical protein VKA46_19330 [Gemmataceae bacterium]|nr:hypothetical protein [Gemmataceae bacterium]